MTQVLEKVRNTESLGREFLAWLWFKSETNHGVFDLGEDEKAEIWFSGRMTLQSVHDMGVETITCTGDHPNMREARFALAEKKEITQARIQLTLSDHQWSFVMESTWMNYGAFKTPKVMQDRDEDPDGIFYEKIYLIEAALSAMDAIFGQFISLRISPEWETEEYPRMLRWIHEIN